MADQARVVVIGGGITGVSVAYHLAEAGWTDVLLVEKAGLTAGSTSQAAGLVTAFNPSSTMLAWRRYSIELYGRLGVFSAVGSRAARVVAGAAQGARADGEPGARRGPRRRRHLGRGGAAAHARDLAGVPVRRGLPARRRLPRPARRDVSRSRMRRGSSASGSGRTRGSPGSSSGRGARFAACSSRTASPSTRSSS